MMELNMQITTTEEKLKGKSQMAFQPPVVIKMEAARKATVERDAELDIAEISHIDMIKVIETIAILEDDEAQAAHARKSEMSWEDLNGLFNEICNGFTNEIIHLYMKILFHNDYNSCYFLKSYNE